MVAILCFFIGFAYFPSLWGADYYDDQQYIFDNPNIKSISSLFTALKQFYINRGWVQLSFALDWIGYSGSPMGMHVSSIGYHIATTLLVWLVVNRIFKILGESSLKDLPVHYFGLPAAVFFGLHPINTQPVTHLISRSDILATLFFLVGLYFALKIFYSNSHWYGILSSEPTRLFVISLWIGICTTLGFGAKEIIITLPIMFLIVLALLWRQEKFINNAKKLGMVVLPLFVVFLIYVFLRIKTFGSVIGFHDAAIRPWTVNFITQVCVIVTYYIPRIILPIHLYYDPDFPEIVSWQNGYFIISAIGIAFLVIIAIRCFRRQPIITLGIFWFLITLLPTSSWIPLLDIVAERRVYLPSIGCAMIFEYFWLLGFTRAHIIFKTIRIGFTIYVLLFFTLLTYLRNYEYSDPIAFWKKEVIYSPARLRPFFNLLHAYIQKNQMDEAIRLFQSRNEDPQLFLSFLKNPDGVDYFLRFLLANKKEIPLAVQTAEQQVQDHPQSLQYLNTLQIANILANRYEAAEKAVDQALALDPDHLLSLLNKANLYKIHRDFKNAIVWVEKAVQRHPDSIPAWKELANLYEDSGIDSSAARKKIGELEEQKKLDRKLNVDYTVPVDRN